MTFEKLKNELPYAYKAFKEYLEENGIDGGSTTIDEQASADFCEYLKREKIFCQSMEEADFELRQQKVKRYLETNYYDPKDYINMGRWEEIRQDCHTNIIEVDDMKIVVRIFPPAKATNIRSFVWAFI